MTSFFLSCPAFLKIITIFFLIFILNRRIPLFLALSIAALLLSLWCGMDLQWFISTAFKHIIASDSIWLCVIVGFVLIFSNLLKNVGQVQRIIEAFEHVFSSRRFMAAALPSLIGLLPMPGGAIFSAPMTEAALSGNEFKDTVSPALKMNINYWFRHVWEHWWPLYPGMILALAFIKIPALFFLAAMFPLSLTASLGGYLFFLRKIPNSSSSQQVKGALSATFFREISPVLLLVGSFLLLQLLIVITESLLGSTFSPLFSFIILSKNYFSFFLAIIISMYFLIMRNHVKLSTFTDTIKTAKILPMLLLICIIMIFKGVLSDSQIIEQIKIDLADYNISPLVIVGVLPLISGAVIGLAVGFVGISFPLVVSLVPSDHALPYFVLAYSMGVLGMMLSPAHLCLAITKEYFKADLKDIYKGLLKVIIFNFLCVCLFVSLYFVL